MVVPSNWMLGLILNLIGSVLINGGTNLIKLAHNYHARYTALNESRTTDTNNSSSSHSNSHEKNDGTENSSSSILHYNRSDQTSEKRPKARSGRWVYISGILTFSLGSLVNFMSFGFAPQSLLAALGSAQFVSNVAFGAFLLGERVTRRTLLATVTIVSGNMMVVCSFSGISAFQNSGEGNIGDGQRLDIPNNNVLSSESYDVGEVKSYEDEIVVDSIRNNFDMAFVLFTIILFSCGFLIRRLYRRMHDRVLAGESVRMSGLVIPISFAAYSAMFGAQSILLAKCLSMLIKARVNGSIEEDLGLLERALFILWCLPTAFWLSQLNRALAMFDGLIIIPLMQVCWMFFSILSGGVFFKEFHSFKWVEIQLFCIGVLIVFYGVYLLFPPNVISGGEISLPFQRNRSSIIEMKNFLDEEIETGSFSENERIQ